MVEYFSNNTCLSCNGLAAKISQLVKVIVLSMFSKDAHITNIVLTTIALSMVIALLVIIRFKKFIIEKVV